jgi:signal transduction histidine kinase
MQAQDVERASISRELHDSIAQTLAAVRFQVAAAARETDAGETRNRLAAVNAMISSAMEEIMNVSYTLHSRVAEDLGIEAALSALARQVRDRSGIEVTVNVKHAALSTGAISPSLSATLFRVAEEVLRSIETRSDAGSASVDLMVAETFVSIEITDDGDSAEIPLLPGLNSVKDRVLLAGGKMTIGTTESGGMKVRAEMKTMRAAS